MSNREVSRKKIGYGIGVINWGFSRVQRKKRLGGRSTGNLRFGGGRPKQEIEWNCGREKDYIPDIVMSCGAGQSDSACLGHYKSQLG